MQDPTRVSLDASNLLQNLTNIKQNSDKDANLEMNTEVPLL